MLDEGFGLQDREPGFELWGAATGPDNRGGLEYAVGAVQGTPSTDAQYSGTPTPAAVPSNYGFKDYYWNASYKLGGFGVVGSRDESDVLDATNSYAEKSLAVGAFEYRGTRDPEIAGFDNDGFTRSGEKMDIYYGKLNLYGAIVRGRDVLQGSPPETIKSSAFFAEADYMALPWVMPLIRFEKTSFSDGRRDVMTAVPAVNLAIRANIRLEIEGHFYNRPSPNSTVRSGVNQAVARLDFLF